MNARVLIAEPLEFSPRAVELLKRGGAEVTLRALPAAALPEAFQQYDVVWFRLAHRIDPASLGAQPRCRVLATPVTGLDHIDLEACAARGIRVVSLRGEVEFLKSVRATAELTIGLMLALLRRIPDAREDVRAGRWRRDAFRGRELYEKTVGIVGLGRLGSIVAAMARAFGCRVLGADPRPDFPDALAERVTLDELLAASDIVTLHVSYGEATRHLIDGAALSRMKPSAVLINTARGGVVDEAALLHALEHGQIAGAALDVLDGEPDVGAAHAVLQATQRLPQLLVTPHIGGNTHESFEKTELFLAERVLEALETTRARAT